MARFPAPIVSLMALALTAACNTGEFAGSGAKKEATSGKSDANPATDDKGKDPGGDLGNPGDDPSESPGDRADNSTPGNGDDSNVNDVLNGLLGGDQDDAVSQPSDDEIIYGGTKVFHIGDSQMNTTTCSEGINQFSLAGRRYYFEFQVTQADTTVTISVNRICGVDYSDTNTLALAHSGAYVKEQKLVVGATNATMESGPLAPGRYAIAIESKVGSADAEESVRAFDADDYIVGEVKLKASKPIKPGKVGAQ